jgi:hypothetical protein
MTNPTRSFLKRTKNEPARSYRSGVSRTFGTLSSTGKKKSKMCQRCGYSQAEEPVAAVGVGVVFEDKRTNRVLR